MNRLALVLTMTGTLAAGAQARAADWKGRSLSAKRQTVSQIIECMKKRMSSDRAISYNEAAKVCKAQVLAQNPASPRGPLVAADTSQKR